MSNYKFYEVGYGTVEIESYDGAIFNLSVEECLQLRDFLLGLYPIQKSITVDMQIGDVTDGSSVVGLVIDSL